MGSTCSQRQRCGSATPRRKTHEWRLVENYEKLLAVLLRWWQFWPKTVVASRLRCDGGITADYASQATFPHIIQISKPLSVIFYKQQCAKSQIYTFIKRTEELVVLCIITVDISSVRSSLFTNRSTCLAISISLRLVTCPFNGPRVITCAKCNTLFRLSSPRAKTVGNFKIALSKKIALLLHRHGDIPCSLVVT